ncbi:MULTISPECIES: Fur family transcriptional regulator [Sphingobacterium]|jgi:Fur family ferric uptake transcriptional regulator|uniref:Transcriptional repressor n=2 Tax=Sphingobacterium TaxID=28453 RepID=A0ACD5BZI3_9SPHI|nr:MULTISPECIES: transcriptional repressor [Sphingobacterium]HAE68842.1 transcriptional repressor [Sphingobacterium sp.]KKO93102.1 Fur family transcriptional regulator [Sphingobacterium sp. Ag1]MDF2853369.1 Fur family transcriptional regulator [Sphingobacterium multivorum]OFV18360.1 Fur family transcriptional regulator [Sphingobacterium sp. HMSC13C05]OJZ06703.1 MAG: Fur family transcriptional regulator [Sphingobacterium sp. 40-24]
MEDSNTVYPEILKRNSLKVTQPRLKVLEIISRKDSAISQPELEKLLGKDIDRVTLYRVLASFEEKGIIHKIFDLHGTATYAMCSTNCSEHDHHDQHVHFICRVCNSVYCLEDMTLPKVSIPAGFSLEAIAVNALGVCNHCKK